MKGSEVLVICLLVVFSGSSLAQTTEGVEKNEEEGFKLHTEYVTFNDLEVTLTCPESSEKVKWSENGEAGAELNIKNYKDNAKKLYYCEVSGKKYYFYIKAKVCKNCREMPFSVLIGLVFGDVLLTGGIILTIFVCSKKKTSPAPPQRAAHSRQPTAPRPPEPDYQPLNPATRSQDTYAVAGRRAH